MNYTINTKKYELDSDIYTQVIKESTASENVNDSDIYTRDPQDDYDATAIYEAEGIVKYRCKTIRSGKYTELEIYPIWNTRAEMRGSRINASREAQQHLNRKNAVKHVIRLANVNFTDDDIWATFTYDNANCPNSAEAAQKEFAKYIRRLKYYMCKHYDEDLKYIYVTEYDDSGKKKIRAHHHVIMNFPDRDIAEQLWYGGARRQTRRLQADENGYEGLVRYIMKDPRGTKSYTCSRNLAKPKVTISDNKFSKRRIKRIATSNETAIRELQKLFGEYIYNSMSVSTSPYINGVYLHIKLTRRSKDANCLHIRR